MEIDADENPKLRSEKKKKTVLKERKNEEKYSTYIVWSQGEIENNFNAIRITTPKHIAKAKHA